MLQAYYIRKNFYPNFNLISYKWIHENFIFMREVQN
jgi:hypothetical protein